MRVLVTGGAGFILANLVRHLLEETGVSVVTLDALTYAGTTDNIESVLDHPRHEFVRGMSGTNRSLENSSRLSTLSSTSLRKPTSIDQSGTRIHS